MYRTLNFMRFAKILRPISKSVSAFSFVFPRPLRNGTLLHRQHRFDDSSWDSLFLGAYHLRNRLDLETALSNRWKRSRTLLIRS
jgi:hypothetical protein